MNQRQLLYQIALTHVPGIGPIQAKLLLECFGSAAAIFAAKKTNLEKVEGIGAVKATAIKNFDAYKKAEAEILFIEKYKITPLFITDETYPQKLRTCTDAPILLYYRGKANLNAAKIVAIIGTRNRTDYGKQLTENLVKELAAANVTIVSGLAFGVDAAAHKAAVKNQLPTIGVLAHGLDTIYPSEHTSLAKDIIKAGGGLLTEYGQKTKPDKHNFPTRNRIVAGMCDATVVIETDIKGGSMITASLAGAYKRDVFAYPGRVGDTKSAGCNYLIQHQKAQLIQSASDLLQAMGWLQPAKKTAKLQRELFIHLTEAEKKVVALLQSNEALHVDVINSLSTLTSSEVAAALLNLELQNVVASRPGKQYALL